MKLLFTIDHLGSGGAQRQIVMLARGAADAGHEVEFFVYYQRDHFRPLLDEKGIVVHTCQKSGRFDIRVPFALRKLLRTGKYDVAVAFLGTASLYLELASQFTDVKTVVSERSAYPDGPLSVGRRVTQQLHRLASRITVNSHHQRERMIREFPWMKQRISTILNGVDLDQFVPNSSHPKSDGRLRLVAVGTVVDNKNAHTLAEAVAISRERGVDLSVSWVGKIRNTAHAYHERLLDRIESLGISKSWEWLGECDDIPSILQKYDGVIHPSFMEGLPNAICEGLASGMPILCSKIGDNLRLIDNGKNGFHFMPDSAESIADAISRLSNLSSVDYEKMCENSRAFAEEHLAVGVFVDNYLQLFRSIIS